MGKWFYEASQRSRRDMSPNNVELVNGTFNIRKGDMNGAMALKKVRVCLLRHPVYPNGLYSSESCHVPDSKVNQSLVLSLHTVNLP